MTIHLIRDLETLHGDLLTMGQTVEQMIEKAVHGLSQPSDALARELTAQDDDIDRWDVRIEEECLKILALHQPVAMDLRRIAAALRMSNELERVADLSVHIAERACGLIGRPAVPIPPGLFEMARVAVSMLHRSLQAYTELNGDLAREVRGDDDLVDGYNRAVIAELESMMQRSPELVEPALHLFSVSKHLERIADHATNVCKDVLYLVGGRIVRHYSKLHRDAS